MRHITATDYLHKRSPWMHQHRIFMQSRDAEAWGFFMEQGTGKSMVMIDTAAWAYMQGRITAALIVCDKGIVRTWLEEHLPENMPDHIPYSVLEYDAARAATKKAQAARNQALTCPELLVVLTNWAAFRTDKGRHFMEQIVRSRDTLMMLDESDAIKTPKAKQTRAITTVGKRAAMRRIATGTPVADGPFDIFAQMRFLDPTILGTTSFLAFKHEYGVWEKRFTATHSYPHLINYQSLNELHAIVDRHSHRVLKEECFDLPPKVYERVYVDLGPAAEALYRELKNSLTLGGQPVGHPLVALLRATQIAAGFYVEAGAAAKDLYEDLVGHMANGDTVRPTSAEELNESFRLKGSAKARIFDEQPKADAIVQQIKRMGRTRQAIVWGQFLVELDILTARLEAAGISWTRYDGTMPMESRNSAERLFKEGTCQVIIATTQAAGKGRNWQNASAVFYHSNSPKLILRLQSEDRAHRGGTKHSVTYWDICAEGTGDAKRLEALRGKKNLADIVNGDNIKEWL